MAQRSLLPRKATAPEVTVSRHVVVIDVQQVELVNNAARGEVIRRANGFHDFTDRSLLGAEAINSYGNGLGHADSIRQLDFATFGVSGANDVFCDFPRHISTASVDLRGTRSDRSRQMSRQ